KSRIRHFWQNGLFETRIRQSSEIHWSDIHLKLPSDEDQYRRTESSLGPELAKLTASRGSDSLLVQCHQRQRIDHSLDQHVLHVALPLLHHTLERFVLQRILKGFPRRRSATRENDLLFSFVGECNARARVPLHCSARS